MLDRLSRYWKEGFPNVEGWVNPDHIDCLNIVANVQSRLGVLGGACEIGVYHGKFLLALSQMINSGTKAVCIDVFDDQSKNLDGAGKGDLDLLKENVRRYGRSDIKYEYVRADSSALTASDKLSLVQQYGPFKLFSVDGCHTAEHTFNDLLTAQEFISPGGVVILDDYMQPHWPGVTAAVHLLYERTVPRIRPFLYSSHKLYFCGIGNHVDYLQAATDFDWHGRERRNVEMFGTRIASIYP